MASQTVISSNRPAGEGWSISGYQDRRVNSGKFGSGFYTQKIPVWSRAQEASPAAEDAAPAVPAPIQEQIDAAKAAAAAAQNKAVEPYPSRAAAGSGTPGSATSVQQLYQQILGRAPENQAAVDYWNKAFGESIDSSEVLAFTNAAQKEIAGRYAPKPRQNTFDSAAASALEALQIQMQEQNAAMQAQAAQQAQFLEQTMQAQQAQYNAQLEQSRQQQAAMEAQAAEQRRQSDALQRAYVPNLEPTAAAPSIGDARGGSRKSANNTLSTLAVLTGADGTGLSSAASALAGLQIA